MEWYVDFLERHRYKIIVFFSVIVALLAVTLKDISFEGSYKIWFDKEDPIVREYEDFCATFSTDESFIVAFRDKNGIFTQKNIAFILALSKEFESLEGVRRVDSLSSYKQISADADSLQVEAFIQDADVSLDAKKTEALHDTLVRDLLISSDATTSMFAIRLLDTHAGDEARHIKLYNELQSIIERVEKEDGHHLYITGAPAITASLVTISQHDMALLLPVAVLVVVFLFYFLFRSFIGIFLPSIVIVFSVVIVLSIEILLGYKLNNFTVNIPSFISAVSIADVMHLYLAWIYFRTKGSDPKNSVLMALRYNLLPIAFTSMTTAAGFASLGMSAIEPIATFGIALVVGSLTAFVLSVTLVPSFLLCQSSTNSPLLPRFLNMTYVKGYGAFIAEHAMKILSTFVVLLAVLGYGMSYLRVDSHSIKYFSEETPVRKGSDFVEKYLTGPMIYEVVVDSKIKGGMKEPRFLEAIERFETRLKAHAKEVRFSTSIKDIIVRMDETIDENRTDMIPQNADLIAQYLILYAMSLPSSDEINEKIDTFERYTRISVYLDLQESSKDLELIKWIENWWKENTDYTAKVEGQNALFAFMQTSVSRTLLVSIGITLAVVSLLMSLLFRKISHLWLFLLPNIAPVVFVGGVMGYCGISIDIGVAISAAVILGIAVDDTIHFFSKYFHSRKDSGFEESIDEVMRHSAAAMILTTFILSVTFAVFFLSDFIPNVNFAIVTITALNLALLFDLVLLPALLSLLERKR